MGHNKSPRCIKVGLKKGPWSPEEDRKLLDYIEKHGLVTWRALPAKAGLWRCGKSCRLRWRNYLRPDIKRGEFSLQEEQTIIQLHALLGNRWSIIANHLPRRTDNEIKNHWNTHLKKRLTKMGIDPVTHKRKTYAVGSSINNNNKSKEAANINHLAQWETARVEAEGRLASMSSSKLLHFSASANNYNYNPLAKTTTVVHQRPPCLDVLGASQQGAYAWTSTKPNNNNNNGFLITSPLIFGGSSDDDDGFGAIPQTNLLYSSSIINSTSTTTYEVLGIAEEEHIQNNNNNNNNNNGGGGSGIEVEEIIRVHGRFIPSHVAGSNLELSAARAGFMETFAGELSSSSSSSCPSNYALQQWIEGPSDHLNCPTGIMY